jgi:hypothetical protein
VGVGKASYSGRDKPVEDRFAPFAPDMAARHGVYAPECRYREKELREMVEKAGLAVERSWTSAFGNPKIVARSA